MCKRDVEKRTAKNRKEHVQISSLFKTSKQLALLAVHLYVFEASIPTIC
jgi:hypothetical protein